VTGGAEPALLELTASLPVEILIRQLNDSLPPGIRIGTCEEVPEAGSRDVLNAFDRAEYSVVCACPTGTDPAAVSAAICDLLARTEICITREREGRSKTVDIRPYLFQLSLCPESPADERLTLNMMVALGEGGSAKPGEVVAALSGLLPGLTLRRAHRVKLIKSGG
jgi:radical SAM-linked protein